MSTHQITLLTPKHGALVVQAGYDAQMSEAYLVFEAADCEYMSPSGTRIDDLQQLAQEQLGVHLPQTIIDGIQEDLADLRVGAADVNRRVYMYQPDGTILGGISV